MKFQIDKQVTIGSILLALRTEGVKTGDVAKSIEGISEKPLRNALKEAGYVFSNKAPKGWYFKGKGNEPLDKSIFDYVKRSSSKVNKDSQGVIQRNIISNITVNKGNIPVRKENTDITEISPVIHPQFTRDEVADLVEMLQEWRMKKSSEQLGTVHEPEQVHERIKTLPQGKKTRKTIVISENIGKRLDAYCKAERVNKSDILHLAIEDFLNNVKK